VRPEDPIVRGFLRDSFVARVATQSRSGRPALTPLWFIFQDGHLFMATGQGSLAARNTVARPEVALLLDGEAAGRSEYVLRVRGRGVVHPGLPTWSLLARIALRYYLAPSAARIELAHAPLWGLRQRYYAEGQGAVIEVVPETAELLQRPD
jgi:hypothetical protein